MDDIKSDQRTQILVSGMIFFAIIFPMYFSYAAGSTDVSYTIGGPVGNYSVEGTYSYHTLGEGTVSVADGESESFTVNTDMVSSEIEGKNIVGVRATLTYEDNEQAPAAGGCSTAEDDVTGHLMHEDLHMIEPVQSGSTISIEWHDSSLVNTNVSNMSESDIEAMLDNTEMIGYGEQFLEITVDVNNGDCVNPFFETNDDGEDVTYTWELISLEYEINAID